VHILEPVGSLVAKLRLIRHSDCCHAELNTYTMHNIGYFGEPDFVHPRDAIDRYLDRLNDGGFLLFEERDINERCRCGIFKLLSNCLRALEDRGWQEPGRHFFN